MLDQIKVDFDIDKLTSCTIIETNYPKAIDKLIFEYAKKNKKHLSIISVQNENWQDKITKFNNELLYIIDIHLLKKAEKEQMLKLIQDKEFIICTTTTLECDFDTISITTESKLNDHNEILTIDDYVKYIVKHFQYKFPDTELSKKLGISRKSLWEKRKKYGLFKNK
jgi:DNA-binding Lrp family transcriptional regulator